MTKANYPLLNMLYSVTTYWTELPSKHGPIYGHLLQMSPIVALIITITAYIFRNLIKIATSTPYRQGFNPIPSAEQQPTAEQQPSRSYNVTFSAQETISVKSGLKFFELFLEVYKEPADMPGIIQNQHLQAPPINSAVKSDSALLSLPEPILVEIFSYANVEVVFSLTKTCRLFRELIQQNPPPSISDLMEKSFTDQHLCNIMETQFRLIPKGYQYLLYLALCKKFPYSQSQSLTSSIDKGKGLVQYFIRRIGPFTFLTIPYVKDFSSPSQAPIERCTINGLVQFRFRLEVEGSIVSQEIAEQADGVWVTSNDPGFWPKERILKDQHIKMLLACLRKETYRGNKSVGLCKDLSTTADSHPFVPAAIPITVKNYAHS